MALIATMKKLENGTIEGKVKTAILNFHLKLYPLDGAGDDKSPTIAPRFPGMKPGQAGKKISEQNNPYVSVQIDDPALPAPIHANLIEKEGEYLLLWSRKD
jgi:uncharacterized protein (DUF736 family)